MGIFDKIFSAFSIWADVYEDDEKRIIASYLRIFLIVSIILLPVYVLIKIIGEGFLPSSFINFSLALFCIFLLYVLNKGKVVLAGSLFLLMSWVAMTAMAVYADGVQDMAIAAYILIIFLATLFSGVRFAVVITVMSIISVWTLAILQNRGLLVYTGDKPINYSRDYTIIFAMVLTAIILLSRSFRHSLNRVNWELKERIKAEERLSKNEQSLIEKNAELMIARDKAEESDRLKTAFIQNISHEIRTPMNGIVGFVELLQQPGIDYDKKAEYVAIVNSCTLQLASLVNDFIDISKIESGNIVFNDSDFFISDMVDELKKSFSKSAMEKGLGFTVLNDAGKCFIRSDRDKIRKALENLVSNAIKFTQRGNVIVKISKSDNKLVFAVFDSGIGVKDTDKEIIFHRFRQVETGPNRSYGGSGLGLAISKGIVEFMGGNIWFDSKAGEGSMFAFDVPVEFLAGSHKIKEESDVKLFTGKLKLIIAEDDEISYLYIRELMTGTDCILLWAKNGSEAVEMLKNSDGIDIVLMDLNMPVMNGYEATQKIKELNPEIPVIAITAFPYQLEVDKASADLFDGYVVKPVEKDDLFLRISKALKEK
jgi:signal transduction histidine kinase